MKLMRHVRSFVAATGVGQLPRGVSAYVASRRSARKGKARFESV